jgi:carotenoid 1,2-hydratase
VVPGGYRWWYVDALADDGRHALTIIAFVGSVFSPYYHRAHRRALAAGWDGADPDNHICLNVALYGPRASARWTMTERSRVAGERGAREFVIGPSALHWDGEALSIDINEWANPWPHKVRGRVVVRPRGLSRFGAALDAQGRHRWGPLAPSARVEVDLASPGLRWSGEGYLDSNEGDEPVAQGFAEWHWLRARLADGSTAVAYDLREPGGGQRTIAARFGADGRAGPIELPPCRPLPASAWRVQRVARAGEGARVNRSLEDTPFYARSVLDAELCGERVAAMHESLDCRRLDSTWVRGLLPFRMPRRAA